MAIKTVQATINGVPTTLTLNQSTGSMKLRLLLRQNQVTIKAVDITM